MSRKKIFGILAVVVLVGAWYAFRPEKLFINQSVNETFPATATASMGSAPASQLLASGRFHGVAHDGQGLASIFQLPNGQQVLRLTEFATSNGPELQLYLVAASDASDSKMVTAAGFVSLGPLKGNMGDQNYDIPAGTDLTQYRAVTVWCKRFGVNFTTAPLATSSAQQSQPAVLVSGRFHSAAHEGTGVATVYQLPDNKRVLRLTEFQTSNGPELQLYLVAASDASDSKMVTDAGFVSLGPLKGNMGDQNYEIPENLDLAKYRAVTVWCKRFGVNFTTAPLAP